jgi:DNA polymerase III subunit epsilon
MNPALSLAEVDFCVIDTETTGGSAEFNRVIDVAVFHYRDGIVLDKFETLINPGVAIPPWITALTGIDDGMVRDAPTFAEIAPRLREVLSRGVFVAHNAGFDYNFIQQEFLRLGVAWEAPRLCTVRMARHLFPELPSRSLGNLCEHLLIEIFGRHRAAGDAEATVYVLKHCLKLLRQKFGIDTWRDLEACLATGPLKLPEGITIAHIEALPEAPGKIILRDAAGEAVYEGRSNNIRKRIRTIFRASNRSEKVLRIREMVRSIEALAPPALG